MMSDDFYSETARAQKTFRPSGRSSWTGVAPVRPDTRLVEVMQCTPAVSGSPAGNAF
jgi:hypothetical protein